MARSACAFVARYELSLRARTQPGLLEQVLALGDLANGGRVLEATREAERRGLQVEMTLAHARTLCPGLTLLPPDPTLREAAERELLAALGTCSPLLDLDRRGAFFLGLDGLGRIFPSEAGFAQAVRAAFTPLGLSPGLAIADSPFVAWVAARRQAAQAPPQTQVLPPGAEQCFLSTVPLAELGLSERALELLRLLGLRQAGALRELPPGALTRRLGPEGQRLERLLSGEGLFAWPTSANLPLEPEEVSLELDGPTEGLEPLLFLFKSLLDRLCAALAQGRQALSELTLEVRLDDRTTVRHALAPAEPTLSAPSLLALARLWLGTRPFGAPVVALRLIASATRPASSRQLSLFAQREEKAHDALVTAVARLNAAFGRDAVVTPVLADTLRPEARVAWRPFTPQGVWGQGASGRSAGERPPTVILRLLTPPEPVRWIRRGVLQRPHHPPLAVRAVEPPHRVSGEWWEAPFDRRYLWLAGPGGERLWVFEDAKDGALYLHAVAD